MGAVKAQDRGQILWVPKGLLNDLETRCLKPVDLMRLRSLDVDVREVPDDFVPKDLHAVDLPPQMGVEEGSGPDGHVLLRGPHA